MMVLRAAKGGAVNRAAPGTNGRHSVGVGEDGRQDGRGSDDGEDGEKEAPKVRDCVVHIDIYVYIFSDHYY